MNIKKGSLFVITSGEYSDYQMITLCKATQYIDVSALRTEYLALSADGKWHWNDNNKFVKWLIVDRKACKELDYSEFYLGGYGDEEFEVINKEDR